MHQRSQSDFYCFSGCAISLAVNILYYLFRVRFIRWLVIRIKRAGFLSINTLTTRFILYFYALCATTTTNCHATRRNETTAELHRLHINKGAVAPTSSFLCCSPFFFAVSLPFIKACCFAPVVPACGTFIFSLAAACF